MKHENIYISKYFNAKEEMNEREIMDHTPDILKHRMPNARICGYEESIFNFLFCPPFKLEEIQHPSKHSYPRGLYNIPQSTITYIRATMSPETFNDIFHPDESHRYTQTRILGFNAIGTLGI